MSLDIIVPDLAAAVNPTALALPGDPETAQARGWWLIPLDLGTKIPAIHRKGHPINEGRRRLSDREFAHYRARGCNFGVMLNPSGLVVVDIEAHGDAGPWAAHASDGPNVVRTWSGGGHAYYSRPADVPARRVIKVRGQDGQRLAVDVLSKGYAVLPGSVVKGDPKPPHAGVYTAPAGFWCEDLPKAPADVLAVLALPELPARVPGLTGLPVLTHVEPGRAERFIVGLVEYWARRIGGMLPDTGRRRALYAAGRAAGEHLHAAPHLEPWVLATFTQAAHVCRLVETDGETSALANLHNGLRDGKANPRDIPNRADWTPTAPGSSTRPAAPSEADRGRAGAVAMLGSDIRARVRLLKDDDGKPINCRTAVTVVLVVGEILRRMRETGGAVIDSAGGLGLTIDRGAAAVWRAFPWLVRLGLDIEIGAAVGSDEGPHGSRFTLSAALLCQLEIGDFRQISGLQTAETAGTAKTPPPDNVHFVLTREATEHATATLRTVAAAGGDDSRGLRRALDDAALQDLATDGANLAPTGDYTPAALAAVEAAGDDGISYAELAAALGCSDSTARRLGPRMVDRGAWIERARLSAAGRSLVVYVAAVVVTRILEAVRAVGARARRWAEGRLEAGREILRKAWALVNGGYFPTIGAALLTIRRKARARAAGEREAVRPGGDRGRPDYGRAAARDAMGPALEWQRFNAAGGFDGVTP